MNYDITGNLHEYHAAISATLTQIPLDKVAGALAVLDGARARGSRIYIFGNGGSAATASHFACDLSKGTINLGTPRMRVSALVDNIATFSAWGNDAGYETVFTEQLKNLLEPGDVVIAISGSGNSPNVLEGIVAAKNNGAITIGLSGFNGGKLAQMVDIAIMVPNHCMEQVEDIHLILAHSMAVCLREMHSNILVVTDDPAELEKAASQYLKIKEQMSVVPVSR